MPSNITDERKWEKAKKIVQDQGKKLDNSWALVKHIYKNLGGKFKSESSLNDDILYLCRLSLKYKNLPFGKKLAKIIANKYNQQQRTAALISIEELREKGIESQQRLDNAEYLPCVRSRSHICKKCVFSEIKDTHANGYCKLLKAAVEGQGHCKYFKSQHNLLSSIFNSQGM